jgi:hypothetical protein
MRSWQEQNEGLYRRGCHLASEDREAVKGGSGMGFILQTSHALSLEFGKLGCGTCQFSHWGPGARCIK